MFSRNKKPQDEKFKQEYLYIEDYYPLPREKIEDIEEQEKRGIIVIDLMGDSDDES